MVEGQGMRDEQQSMRAWALKWVEGSLLGFARGSTPFNIVMGRIKRSVESYGVKPNEILLLIELIEQSPVYLPNLSKEEKIARLRPIKSAVENMCSGK